MTATAEVIDEVGELSPEKEIGTAVATRGTGNAVRRDMVAGLIRPVAEPSEILQSQEQTRELIGSILTPGRDYDTIPGTGKPTMLQPGAERAAAAFGLAPRFEIVEREIDHDRPISFVKRSWEWGQRKGEKIWSEKPGQSEGLYRYVIRCQLVHRESGVVVGEGIGSCSTMESKYIDRPRDLENTVVKMAKKRAYVDAVLTTLGLHDQFTQDVEDNPEAFTGSSNGGSSGSTRASAGTPEPTCPTCSGPMWNNIETKKNPRAPDFKCKDKACDGVVWPGEWPPAEDEQPASDVPAGYDAAGAVNELEALLLECHNLGIDPGDEWRAAYQKEKNREGGMRPVPAKTFRQQLNRAIARAQAAAAKAAKENPTQQPGNTSGGATDQTPEQAGYGDYKAPAFPGEDEEDDLPFD